MDNYNLVIIVDGRKFYFLGMKDDMPFMDEKPKNAIIVNGIEVFEIKEKIKQYFEKMDKKVEIISKKVKY